MTDLPTRVLSDEELDLLELALGDGVPPAVLASALPDLPTTVVLTDVENTPLARITAGSDQAPATVEALKPMPPAVGPQWDTGARRPARDVRADLESRSLADAGPTAARSLLVTLLVTEPPTREETDAAVSLAASADTVLLLVPVARRVPESGRVGAPGLVRAAAGLADALADQTGARVRTVVVPWSGLGDVTLTAVAAAYGAAGATELVAHRSAATTAGVRDLPHVLDGAVAALYPPTSAAEVARASTSGRHHGTVVFFTGLSGSGKSTVARALAAELEDDGLTTTLLDGDEVRHHLSKGLGFDRASRETNVERIGYVASLVAKHGGTAVAAPIAPFAAGRATVRALAAEAGARFVLVHISTSLAVCEARDRKGLYAKARAGEIPDFTGISSPYEEPDDAELVIDTADVSIDAAVRAVRAHLGEHI